MLCRLREGWRPSGSESFEICTRSSNTSEVGLPQLYSTRFLFARFPNIKFWPKGIQCPELARETPLPSLLQSLCIPSVSSRGPLDPLVKIDRHTCFTWLRTIANVSVDVDVLADVTYNNKMMSEEETRELIARQRNALYGEGPFTEKGGYIDETGNVRPGLPGHSGPASLRGHSPLNYEMGRNAPPNDGSASASAADLIQASQHSVQDTGPRANSASSPQPNPTGNKSVFDASVGQSGNRTSNSSPGGSPPRQEMPASSKPGLTGTTVAPIGTRPSGTPATTTAAAKRSTTPLASPGGWGRGNGVWGQSSGLGAQASVWG
jgi:hypothetical protein